MTEELKVVISAEMAKFASAMKEALTALNNIQKELKQTNSESDKTEKKTAKMGEAFKKAFKEAKKSADENFKKIGSAIGDGLKKATAAAKDFAVDAAKAFGAGITAISGGIVALSEGTEEYRVNQAKLQSAFEQANLSAEDATRIYGDLYRVIGDADTTVESAQQIALLTDNIQEASDWASIASGVMGTFGDALKPETFFEAANETLRLNESTGAYTQMLEGAGVNVEQFNKMLQSLKTEEERRNFLLETSKDIMGEAGAAYDKHTEKIQKQREAQQKLQDKLATLGDAVAPVQTAFTNLATEALEKVMPYLTDLAEKYAPMIEPFFQNLADNVLPVLKDVIKEMAEHIATAIGWVVNNWGIIAAITGVITGIATAIGLMNVVEAINNLMKKEEVTTIWALVAAYAAQAAGMVVALAPYLAIVAAIAAVIAIIVVLIKYPDEVKEAFKKMIDFVKERVSGWVEDFKQKFEQIKNAISEKVNATKEKVVNKFQEIKQGITDKIQAAKDSVSNTFTNIQTSMNEKINAAKTAVLGVFDKIKNGIKEKIESARDTVKNVIDKIKGFFDFDFKLPKIPTPHFGISPSGWKVGDLLKGSIPKLSINWYAQGGVFDKPTLFYGNGALSGLGENGAEAVVPLEKNTEWLDKIANRLNGGGKNIVLEVDGTTFGKISCQSINQYAKQTGKLPIKVM